VLQTGFVGFDTLSGDLGYVPANLQSSEAAECSDGELRMIMKRLTKRDAVTKLKVRLSSNYSCLIENLRLQSCFYLKKVLHTDNAYNNIINCK